MRRSFTLLLVLLLCCTVFSENKQVYGPVSAAGYLSGRFDPSKHPLFVNLSDYGIPSRKGSYLRKETAISLKRMLSDFTREHPSVRIFVRSSTRNFYAQKYIWDSKWKGEIKVEGRNLSTMKNPAKKALVILRYSSMPGTSRHHWGTDFDINSLNNRYYEKGDGIIIYAWLKKNASRYGFSQPYISGRKKGYLEEKWHWSYLPLACEFLRDWNRHYEKKPAFFVGKGFLGSTQVHRLAPEYVNSINPDCIR